MKLSYAGSYCEGIILGTIMGFCFSGSWIAVAVIIVLAAIACRYSYKKSTTYL